MANGTHADELLQKLKVQAYVTIDSKDVRDGDKMDSQKKLTNATEKRRAFDVKDENERNSDQIHSNVGHTTATKSLQHPVFPGGHPSKY